MAEGGGEGGRGGGGGAGGGEDSIEARLDDLDARVRRLNYALFRIAFGRKPGPMQVNTPTNGNQRNDK